MMHGLETSYDKKKSSFLMEESNEVVSNMPYAIYIFIDYKKNMIEVLFFSPYIKHQRSIDITTNLGCIESSIGR